MRKELCSLLRIRGAGNQGTHSCGWTVCEIHSRCTCTRNRNLLCPQRGMRRTHGALVLQDKGKRGCRTQTVASSIWHPPPPPPPPLTADHETRCVEGTVTSQPLSSGSPGQVGSWEEWGRGYEEAACATNACKRSECVMFRPSVVAQQQYMEAVAEDAYQDAMGETRADRSDNVTGNWSQVNSCDVNAVII